MPRWLWIALVACSTRDPAIPPPPSPAPASAPAAAALVAPGLRLPEGVAPLGYDLRLELDPGVDAFVGHVAIRVRLAAATDHVWLHADELAITSAHWDGGTLAQLPVRGDQMLAFGFGRPVGPGEVTLVLDYRGGMAHDQEGLFRQSTRDRWYLFSQAESTFARRIAPCFDEPRFKTPWRVTLDVPADQVALANMPVDRERALADGRREVAFAPTPPMASYLLAVAVGPFELVDVGALGRGKVPVRVAALAGDRDRVTIVAQRLPAIVDVLERYLDDPLPWPKLDLVVVPRLFGAMENSGLVTFAEHLISGDPESISFAAEFVHVAAHELAHQWFGNLVTPAWWDDLWLAEAFASWLGERTVDALGLGAPVTRALAREHALEADSEPTAVSLRRQIVSNDDPESSFDAIAYDKGHAVLATFEHFVGDDAFRTAARAYLRAHRNGNATTADFANALAAATSPALGRALAGYVGHAGAPIVDLALDCTGTPELVGRARDGLAIPACVRVAGADAPVCALVGERTELPLASCPAWVQPSGGYYVVAWSSPRPADPPLGALTEAQRIALGEDIDAAVRRGELPPQAAIGELRALAGGDLAGVAAGVAIAQAIDPLVADGDRPAWTRWLAMRFAPRLQPVFLFAPGELSEHVAEALLALVGSDHLPAATAARARQLVAAALARKLPPDPELVLATGGDRVLFDRIAALPRFDPGWAPDALGAFGPALAPAAVELAFGSTSSAAAVAVIADYLQRSATRGAAWTAVHARLPALLAHLASADAAALVDATGALCDAAARAEVAAAFEPEVRSIPDGRAHLDRALAQIDRCVAARARSGDLAAALH